MKFPKSILFCLILVTKIQGQTIGIGTTNPSASAQLEIAATDKGLLIPRIMLTSPEDNV